MHLASGLRYYDRLRLPRARLGGVRYSLSAPDTLHHSSFFVSLCTEQGRVRGWSFLSTPGVFPPTGGTPTPDSTQGDSWLSQVPRFPPCLHALVLDPGGVLDTRLCASRTVAFRTTARRRLSPASQDYPSDHHSTYFGAQYTAWTLDPSGFGLPFPGLPADCSPDLLARL